jgi:hypothetical protein
MTVFRRCLVIRHAISFSVGSFSAFAVSGQPYLVLAVIFMTGFGHIAYEHLLHTIEMHVCLAMSSSRDIAGTDGTSSRSHFHGRLCPVDQGTRAYTALLTAGTQKSQASPSDKGEFLSRARPSFDKRHQQELLYRCSLCSPAEAAE